MRWLGHCVAHTLTGVYVFSIMNEFRYHIIKSISHLDDIKYQSKCDIDESKLRDAYNEVHEALAFYCPESSFSDLIVHQLSMVCSHQCVELQDKLYPYIYSEVLDRMRLVEVNKPKYKPFNGKGSPLKGLKLYHVHHSLNFEVIFNFKRYLEQTYAEESSIVSAIDLLRQKYPERDDHLAMFVKTEVINSVEWGSRNKTGEWLVYQLVGGKVHFLALALHQTSDEELFRQIKLYLK